MPVTTQDLLTCLHRMAEVIEANREYLTSLDAAIGDADHGINMDRGFKAALKRLPPVEDKDAGTILKTVGVTLVSTVGGAGGPLYGTAFMQAGTVLGGEVRTGTTGHSGSPGRGPSGSRDAREGQPGG